MKNLVLKMHLNNCNYEFRRIASILDTPLTTVFSWVKIAGEIVDQMMEIESTKKNP